FTLHPSPFTLFYLLSLISLAACDTTYQSSIPDRAVNLKLDLTFEDRGLVGMGGYEIITKPREANDRLGFGGILVFHAYDDNYYAFDLSCPYEANPNIRVAVDSTGIYAVCPNCGSRFDLSYGLAYPTQGPAKESLRRYAVTPGGGNILYVSN
ncbi:MAG: (2Fe-2S)-binding protein, partial [Tannerella sp.]|nr:(2Fe-2S)-binding protein [Tannerella sp.]